MCSLATGVAMTITKVSALLGLSLLFVAIFSSRQADAQTAVAVFEGKNTLLRPDYRQWVFVGSSLGLNYAPNPPATVNPSVQLFHNVYIDPLAYREFAKSGKFPEGTVMILELASVESKNEPGLQGSYQKTFVALEASVKDSTRFEGGWEIGRASCR